MSALVVARSSRPTKASTDTRSMWVVSFVTGKALITSPCGARTTIKDIILNLNKMGEGEREWFWPAPGRGQTSSTTSIGNLFSCNFFFLHFLKLIFNIFVFAGMLGL